MKSRTVSILILIAFLLTIFLSVLGKADDTINPDYVYKQNDFIDLKRSCFNNGTWCSNTTQCNATIFYPNNSVFINNGLMTNQVSFHNITLPSTTLQGEYLTNIICSDNNKTAQETFFFSITPSGTLLGTGQSIIYVISLVLLFIFFIFCLYGAIAIPWDNHRNEEGEVISMNDLKYVKLLLWFVSYTMLIGLTFLAWNVAYGYLDFPLAANLFNWIYWFLISFFFPVLVVFMIVALLRFLADKRIYNAVEGGLRNF